MENHANAAHCNGIKNFKEEEKLQLEKETKRKIRDKERREIDKEMIQRHRRNQNEIRGQNKFTLEKELRNKVLQ